MVMKPVGSSNLAAVGYDEATQELEIRFHSGHHYRYLGVGPLEHEKLMSSPSKGRYFRAEIRMAYAFIRLV